MPRCMFRFALFLLLLGLTTIATAGQPAEQRSVNDIEKIVREYLLNNPGVIFEAARRYQGKQKRLQAERDRAAVKQHEKQLLEAPAASVGGNPEGDVTLVEFFDYRCGACKRFAPLLTRLTKQDPNLRIVYKELPILGPDSVHAAQAALAAQNQGHYLEFHAALMATAFPLTNEAVTVAARSVGLDVDQLERDMETPKVLNVLDNNHRLGKAMHINSTPTLIVGDNIIRGPMPIRKLLKMITRVRSKDSGPN